MFRKPQVAPAATSAFYAASREEDEAQAAPEPRLHPLRHRESWLPKSQQRAGGSRSCGWGKPFAWASIMPNVNCHPFLPASHPAARAAAHPCCSSGSPAAQSCSPQPPGCCFGSRGGRWQRGTTACCRNRSANGPAAPGGCSHLPSAPAPNPWINGARNRASLRGGSLRSLIKYTVCIPCIDRKLIYMLF